VLIRSFSLGFNLTAECWTLFLFVSSICTDQSKTARRWFLDRGTAVLHVTAMRPDEFFAATPAIRMFNADWGFRDRGMDTTKASVNENKTKTMTTRRFMGINVAPHLPPPEAKVERIKNIRVSGKRRADSAGGG